MKKLFIILPLFALGIFLFYWLLLRPSQAKDCKIKGNISLSGEKIYHLPEQWYYNATNIDKDAGERWFCNEDEAKQAGWRKSKK